jgi:hypothetical protein
VGVAGGGSAAAFIGDVQACGRSILKGDYGAELSGFPVVTALLGGEFQIYLAQAQNL